MHAYACERLLMMGARAHGRMGARAHANGLGLCVPGHERARNALDPQWEQGIMYGSA